MTYQPKTIREAMPMNLREVRKMAEDEKKLYGYEDGLDLLMCDYILATIDPSPEAAITADWLREEFPQTELFKYYENTVAECHVIGMVDTDICLCFEPKNNRVYLFDADSSRMVMELLHITTRQQFTDLARCLGIPRRKDGAK